MSGNQFIFTSRNKPTSVSNFSCRRLQKAVYQFEQSAFSTARFSDNSSNLAFFHSKICLFDSNNLLFGLEDMRNILTMDKRNSAFLRVCRNVLTGGCLCHIN